MNDERQPQTPRSYLSFIASKGGSKGSAAQKAARQANLAKGRQVRIERLKANQNTKPPTP